MDDEASARRSQEIYWPHKNPPTPEDLDMELQQSIAEQMEEGLERETFWRRFKALVKDKRLRISLAVSLTMAVNFSTSSFVLLSSYSTAILRSLDVSNELAKRTFIHSFSLSERASFLGFTICLAFSTILAVFCARILIDKWGRRPLVIYGTISASLLLVCLGILCQLGQSYTSSGLQWTVAIFIILCSFCGRCGVFAVFGVIIPELFPFRWVLRDLGMSKYVFTSHWRIKI